MRVFKNAWFSRFASKEHISDEELKAAAATLENRLYDACLGGSVYKLRVQRPGGGKSRGYRAIVFYKGGERAFFVYGYAKSDRANITGKELRAFQITAKAYVQMTDENIELRLKNQQIFEC